ncbi:YgiW/YdeI family stress tolerance OB fold protein [Motilimonas pumila]|uniref:NirD/YgiW/YdeI family stress tolerance protein n=1 Tax=Motilimonas pumila TaxID=2303987 RepID=A0A418YJQ7_9GAMM|nr:NirD/YgiW/YdeI family stress tolerance protein [Motilimonas pumila]RJG51208.1 NirD/YgiW/YdeI family stress tolerance protein [Motilimonas pumila]
MKQTAIAVILSGAALLTSASWAAFDGPSKVYPLISVTEVEAQTDDAIVKLQGYLIKELKPEHYLFKDDSGEIQVEIDAPVFNQQTVTPSDKVEILAEVDKDWNHVSLEVEKLTLLDGKP